MDIPGWTWFIWWKVLCVLILAYVVLTALLFLFQRRLVYHPSANPMVPWEKPGIPVEDCWIRTEDGVNLHGWWMGQNTEGPVLLFFHGNGGNLTHRVEWLRMLHDEGLRIFAIDYRGYGQSEGAPGESGLYADGRAAYTFLREEKDVAPSNIISYGKSLGTAVALKLALTQPVAGVILESPLASAHAMAREMIPLLPLRPFVRADFGNVRRVPRLDKPLLVIHGDEDETVPFEQGRAVYDAATTMDRDFYCVKGAGHNDVYRVGGRPYFQKIKEFCDRVTRKY